MLLALLLAFSSTPLDHAPRAPGNASQLDRPFFVGEMKRMVEPERVEWNPSETATPVLDPAETRLYVATHDGNVRCQFNGKTAWIFKTDGAVLAAPAIWEETLLVAGGDGALYALNRFTGAVRWKTDTHEELTTTPVIADGRVFLMSSMQSVTAVDLKDGKSLWRQHRDPPGGYTIRGDAAPRVAHGEVFTAFADGTVAALGPADGVPHWTRQVSGSGDYLDVDSLDAPENDSRIYVASAKAGILALDAATGETAWTYALPGANHVLVDGPRIIGGGRGALVALDRAQGKLIWTLKLPKDHYPTQPVVEGGVVLVADDRGPLMGLDSQTGEARGGFDPGSGFSQPVLALPGVAYVISNGGALYSLGLLP
jgi:outer membrane protein assembly factor BamB